MSINKVKINIEKIDLDKIKFKLKPNIAHIEKNQINIYLNDDNFIDYNIFYNEDISDCFYEIIPYIRFNLKDVLTFQIVDHEYISNKVKIYFCEKFDCEGESLLSIKVESQYEGKYIFSIENIDDTDECFNSEPIIISKPIDSNKCKIWTDKKNFNKGEIINTNIEIINKDEDSIIDGLYEVEIDSY